VRVGRLLRLGPAAGRGLHHEGRQRHGHHRVRQVDAPRLLAPPQEPLRPVATFAGPGRSTPGTGARRWEGVTMSPDDEAFEANAAGHLPPGQRRTLLGDPVPPPYPALAILTVVAVGGAALWWRSGFEVGITVVLIGANVGLAAMSMNLDRR